MLTEEQKYIIDCIRDNLADATAKIAHGFSFDTLLNELCNQKLFLTLYPRIKSVIPTEYQKKFSDTYIFHMNKRVKLLKFQKDFIRYLNDLKMKFIILKGFANEVIAYGGEFYRMFGDLDILMDFKTIELLKKALNNSNFNIKSMESFNDYFQHEIRIQIYYKDEYYIVEIKRRHREADFKLTNKFFKNYFMYEDQTDDFKMPILNNDMFYISSCLYLYNYMERINSWLYSKKVRLCYYYDLYQFIVRNNYNISLKTILFCLKFKIIHKIMLIMKYTYDIFLDENIYKIYSRIKKYCYKSYENDFINNGRIRWNIPIIDRLLNHGEIAVFLKDHIAQNFYFGNLKCRKNVGYRKVGNNKTNFKYKIYVLNHMIYIKFKNINFNLNENNLIYISLFCNNTYGIYKFPFEPISIRMCGSEIKVYNRFTVEEELIFLYEREKHMSYKNPDMIKYLLHDKKLDIIINAKYLNFSLKKGEVFGYSIELGKISPSGKVHIIDRTNDVKDRPLLVKI